MEARCVRSRRRISRFKIAREEAILSGVGRDEISFFSNVAIGVFLFLHFVAIVPRQNLAHECLLRVLDPVLDKTGFVQSPWNLFAPKPTRTNVRIKAAIAFDDGRIETWESPDLL